jgi:inositol phosphorylceramide synthase catalytic subunit
MDDLPTPLGGGQKSKLPFLPEALNTAILSRLPGRYEPLGRRRTRSKSKHTPPGVAHISTLQRSFNLWDGIRSLQKHKWQLSDLQYVFLAVLVLVCFSVTPSAPALKLFAVLGGSWLLLMPATRQFFLPSLPIWIWLFYFFGSR